MEPGRDDREHSDLFSVSVGSVSAPRWSPVAMTGNTPVPQRSLMTSKRPRWSPVAMTGNTHVDRLVRVTRDLAAMEPGRDDREHMGLPVGWVTDVSPPRWSPVAMTGNTC